MTSACNAHLGDITRHLPLVKSIARGYRNRGVPFDDLVQEGYLGLRTAAERFRPSRGVAFSTYAGHWIRNRILLAISQTTETIRRPEYIVALDRKVARAEAANPGASDAVIASEALTTEARLSDVRHSRLSRVHPCDDAGETPLSDLAVAPEASRPAETSAWVHAAVGRLSPVEQWVVGSLFGLAIPGVTDGEPRSRKHVALGLNRSPNTVRKIEAAAMAKLKQCLGPAFG